jgi:hypothetical protein
VSSTRGTNKARVTQNDIKDFGRDGRWGSGTKVIVNASECRSKVLGFLDTLLHNRFGESVEGTKSAGRLQAKVFEAKGEDVSVLC